MLTEVTPSLSTIPVYAVSGLVRFYTDFRQEDQASKYGFKAGVEIGFWVNAQKEVEAMWLQAH